MIFMCYYCYRHNYFLLGVVRAGLTACPRLCYNPHKPSNGAWSANVLTTDSQCATMWVVVEPQNLLCRKEKIMARRNFGVSMCGRIEYTRSKPRKAYCKNCIHCLLTEHCTEMYCKKYKRFKSIRQSKKPSCLIAR